VKSAYLLVYRAYIALKQVVLDPIFRRWPRLQRGFDATKNFLVRCVAPSRQVWVQVQAGLAQGMWLHLRIPDEAGFWRGEHEPEAQQIIAAMVRPGDVVYDIGAHLGFLALGAARLVGAAGRVVAVDADPANIPRLHENSARNRLDASIQIVHAAVWSHASTQEIAFRRGTAGTSQGGVEADGERPVLADGELIRVPVITLDSFIVAGGTAPQLIKIDVEGGEHEVLRGGGNLFAQQRPILIVEVHHPQADAQIRGWLQEFRYSAEWKIPRERFPRCLIAWPSERDPQMRRGLDSRPVE
jgi:FkbM family methyltransferase